MRTIFKARISHACHLEDSIKALLDQRKELYSEIRADGGEIAMEAVKLGVKVRDPDKAEQVIHRRSIEDRVWKYTGKGDATGDRTPELEDPIESRIQAGPSRLWGDSEPDAEPGDGDQEAGAGEEGEDVREVQPTNSFTFLD